MFLQIFTIWLSAFSMAFTFLPLMMVFEWKKRGTADGFSSVNIVLATVIQACWLRHGLLTGDNTNIYLNLFNLVFSAFFIFTFAYYQPKRQYLIGQLVGAATLVYSVFLWVDTHDETKINDAMGSAAATMQILSMVGGLYEIKRAVSMKTTEFIPANFQFAIFALIAQWLLFGLLHGNYHIVAANAAGLVLNVATISLYFIYPPLTWTVPIFNIPPQKQDKKTE